MVKKKVKSSLNHQITHEAKKTKKGIEELKRKIKNAKSVSRKNETPKEEIQSTESEEDVSDFSIQDVILQQKPKEQNQQKENLEDVTDGEEVKKNRNNSYEEIKSQESVHSAEVNLKDIYSTGERNGDIYNEVKDEGDVYNKYYEKNELYKSGSDDKYLGHIKEEIKGYAEVEESRRGGRSMLEISGFEDKEKQKQRELRKMRY